MHASDETGVSSSARTRRVGVLALQGSVREHCQALHGLGAVPVEVRTPADLEGVDMLVLPGGESTTMSLLLGSSGLIDPLTERLRDGMPAFGTCAGMILLSAGIVDGRPDQRALGAIDIDVRRNAFGRQVDSFEADLDVEGLESDFHAVFIRAPIVERVGEKVEVLATVTDASGRSRPVLCRQGPILVAAFHPELSGDPRLHQRFLEGAETGFPSAPAVEATRR
ncbi:MAG TPA: pyridoxal 5'-phosphate synthase glutaminase subunit PdxT [Acidimicrobiales bacterium]|nr:pyridoxal 5'-phosphate synthase glutaminase subunit PdxT [Acidimicrobiales bacterium]